MNEDPPPSAASRSLVPWLVAIAFFMEALDTTILNTGVPIRERSKHSGARYEVRIE
jgi:hypothetical protein